MEEPGRLQSMGSWRFGHDWATSLSLFTSMHWRRKWQPTPVFLPGESQGRGSLVAVIYGVTKSQKQQVTWTVSPSIWHEVMGPVAMILVFWMLSFKPTFSLSSFTFIKRLFSSSSLSAIMQSVICITEVIDISPGSLDSSLCFVQPRISHDVLCI